MNALPWLQARDLTFAYPGGAPVVRAVSLDLAKGAMAAVIGANGSGKSTLVRMLAGLLRPASGNILLEGTSLDATQPRERARQIAYVPQATPTAFPFQVLDVVLTGRTPHTSRFRFENIRDREKAMEALETVGAAHLAARRVTELSGGERQMVVLARALAQEPRLLLLDEPSSSLDLKHRAALIRTLARLRDSREIAVLMVTHDLQLTDSLFNWIFALRCGELVAEGPPAAVLQSPLLGDIYDDPHVRTCRVENRTMVWIEA